MTKFQKILETVGLDWFPVLLGKSIFYDTSQEAEKKGFAEIEKKFGKIKSDEKLDDAVTYCNNLLEREEKRLQTIETKAFALLGITGIATGFIIGFAGLLLDATKVNSLPINIYGGVIYFFVVISFIFTIFLSMKVVTVGEYKFTYPSPREILRLADESLLVIKRDRAISTFYSYLKNQEVINQKATYLGGAQLWFRNSIILLLILSLGLAIYSPIKSLSSPTIAITPLITSSSTSTVISKTPVFSPSSTPTLRITKTPYAPNTPTFTLPTKTHKPPTVTPNK